MTEALANRTTAARDPLLIVEGVSKLYETRVRKRDLLFLVLAAFFTLVVITIISEPVRLVLRGFLLPFK